MAFQPPDHPPPSYPGGYDNSEQGGQGMTYPALQPAGVYPGFPQQFSGGYPEARAPPILPAETRQATRVVVAQPVIRTMMVTTYGEMPVAVTCPRCHRNVVSSVSHEPGAGAWCCCIILCLLGFWICAFFPLCMDSASDVVHKCPKCDHRLGTYSR
ncbi:lipopolysaccharide-induced tumor necrosis factor-alpha factor homolog [Glandiceps talaboti]